MITFRKTLTLLAAALAAVSVSACVTVFAKEDPATLYRFGSKAAAPAATAPTGPLFGVLKTPTVFTRAAAGDRLLTVTNGEAAYVAGVRWVSPASILFDEAVAQSFEAGNGRARLIGRGEVAKADLVLRLEVRTFETAYLNGPKAAPEVQIRVRAVLSRNADRALVGDQVFSSTVPAGDNRVTAIITAYDQANADVLSQINRWVNAAGASLPAE